MFSGILLFNNTQLILDNLLNICYNTYVIKKGDNMNIERGFKLAKNASTFSDRKIKIGAVLMYKSKVISVGYNTTKSSPIQKMYNVYRNIDGREYDVEKRANGIHAEIMALQHATRSFKGDLSKCSIFVYSEKKDGTTRLTRPCMGCSKMLKDLGVKNIYYTTNNGWQYERRD